MKNLNRGKGLNMTEEGECDYFSKSYAIQKRFTVSRALGEEPMSLLDTVARLNPSQVWFTPKEVAAILNRTDQFVRDLLENRRIFGYALYAKGKSQRKSYQIHRTALELYLIETANFAPEELSELIVRLIRALPPKQIDAIRRVV
jgi:hypothetical protein